MKDLKIGEMEYRFMSIIWENEPLSSRTLVELCMDKLGWKKSTTYSTLKKLSEKGLLQNINSQVNSLISQEELQTYRSEKFVENTFSGSLPCFLAAFLGGRKISQKEADRLKKLIDSHRED
ncbi:MAG: BlaI/MecI/CopY family transcriptional regulator [Oscillospiraceae bacterium]|nr:BlaI/MecI/CopY family transcriptional regulator [Oscillospiraceae bacterium]